MDLTLLFLLGMLSGTYGQRTCRNSQLDQVRESGFAMNHSVQIDSATGNLDLLVTIKWDSVIPTGFNIDGYLYHMGEDTLTPSLQAWDHCYPGRNSTWVRTTNESVCIGEPPPNCPQNLTADKGCLCDINSCSLTMREIETRCRGVRHFVGANFVSTSFDTRMLTFKVEFFKHYQFRLRPHHREAVRLISNLYEVPAFSDCVQTIRNDFPHLTNISVENLCCAAGVPQTTPRDVTIGRFIPDISNGGVTDVSVEITWRPPVTQENLVDVVILIFPNDVTVMPPNRKTVEILLVARNGSVCDHNPSLTYKVNVTGLLVGESYTVIVEPRYNTSICLNRQCTTSTTFTPEVNVCLPEWNVCDVNATCSTNSTNAATNATCTCSTGFEGNGFTNATGQLGNGCTDIDHCVAALNPCTQSAVCVDKPAPELGATCFCSSHFFGDGFKSGRDCTPISTIILAITIPTVCFLLFLVAWKVRVHMVRKKELTWSEFVANKSRMVDFVATKMTEESNCLPTFGEKWELDRNKIKLEEILGRGNYGIVHKGRVQEKDSSMMVAIKTMKDGTHSKERLLEFLTEINFMLNIGNHPNVLSVIGCCTVDKQVLLVTELLKYGDMLGFLHSAREPEKRKNDPVYCITEKSLWKMAHHVALGMEFLTKSRIIHGDIAARNILVGEDLVCKISDFGLANDVYRYGLIRGRTERCVPYKWISPERMMSGEVPITSRSDVWSFGNLLYEMVTLGCAPYPGIEQVDLLNKIKEGYRMNRPSSCCPEMYTLMKKCWKFDPWKRPTFHQIVKETSNAILGMKGLDNVDLTEAVKSGAFSDI